MSLLRNVCCSLLAVLLFAAPAAFGSTISYANITASTGSLVTGTVAGVGFTVSGPTAFVQLSNGGGTNYFVPTSPVYFGGTISNAPTDSGLIAIQQGGAKYTIHFAAPVTGLVFSEVSLGDGPLTSYTFDQQFSVQSCGTGYWGGGCFNQALGSTGNTVLSGGESSGSIQFASTFQNLSFQVSPNSEYWNGFDLGLPQTNTGLNPVPEPGTLVMVGTGLLGLLGAAKRKLFA